MQGGPGLEHCSNVEIPAYPSDPHTDTSYIIWKIGCQMLLSFVDVVIITSSRYPLL